MPDYKCTLWPDDWFGFNITDLCAKHDSGEYTDWELSRQVMKRAPVLVPVGAAMFLGLSTLGKVYRFVKKRQENRK